jgi:hypothetical protein
MESRVKKASNVLAPTRWQDKVPAKEKEKGKKTSKTKERDGRKRPDTLYYSKGFCPNKTQLINVVFEQKQAKRK